MGVIKNFIERQDTLERKLFWIILLVVTFAATSSAIFTIAEGLNIAASICSIACIFVCIVIAGVAIKTSLYSQCYIILCCVLSMFLMPLLFMFCGGITSGMPMYFITTLTLLSFAEKGRLRTFSFIVSMLVQLTTFVLTWFNPEYVAITLNREDSYLDFIVTFLVTSVTLFIIETFCMQSFRNERHKREEMMHRLEYISKRDALTDLYNRRYLIQYLENLSVQLQDKFYILVINIDDFRDINETWGFKFGDQVISSISQIILQNQNEAIGECAARYGGEKFVYIIREESNTAAFFKADRIRECVSMLHWIDKPSVHVTISGGFVSCRNKGYYDETIILEKLENLLNVVKSMGRDQIRDLSE